MYVMFMHWKLNLKENNFMAKIKIKHIVSFVGVGVALGGLIFGDVSVKYIQQKLLLIYALLKKLLLIQIHIIKHCLKQMKLSKKSLKKV